MEPLNGGCFQAYVRGMDSWMKFLKASIALAIAASLVWGARALADAPSSKASKTPAPKARTVELTVTEKGFEPSPLKVKKGEPLKLVVTRKTENTCATELILPQYKIEKALPMGEPVEIRFTPDKAGELKYGCGMGMMISGILVVE